MKKRRENQLLSYYLFNKPFGVLCQFSGGEGKETLAAYGPFSNHVYPAGRLDADSEGLILLTNDGSLQHVLLEPKYRHPRTYVAQVERVPDEDALDNLRQGVMIEGHTTLPVEVELLEVEPDFPPRPVPIRYRKNIPAAWIRLTLREGRNRQVRKMTAAVGHPTLRLIRTQIGPLTLEGLQPGEKRELTMKEIELLKEFLQE